MKNKTLLIPDILIHKSPLAVHRLPMRGFTAGNTPYMGLVDRRPVVCRNLAMGFWVPLQQYITERHRILQWRWCQSTWTRPIFRWSPTRHLDSPFSTVSGRIELTLACAKNTTKLTDFRGCF